MIKVMLLLICLAIGKMTIGQTTITLHIDPNDANGGTVSQLFDSVTYIPLETKKESLFGRIDKLILTNKYFIILDHNTDAIYLFKKDGKFYSKITLDKWIKTNNKEDLGIRDFTVNENMENVVVSHRLKHNKLYLFDFKGNLLKTIENKVSDKVECIDKDHYLTEIWGDLPGSSQKPGGHTIIIDNQTFSFKLNLLNRIESKLNISGGRSVTTLLNSNKVFYTRSYDYNAYLIDSNGIAGIYHFVFPLQYTLPKAFLDSSFTGKQRDYLYQNYKTIYTLSDVYKTKNMLLFSTNAIEYLKPFMYNPVTNNLYDLYKISPDSGNGFLPFEEGGFYESPLAADSGSFYTSVSSDDLIGASKSEIDKKPVYNTVMQEFFRTQNRQSNPVIVKLTPKDNL